MESERYRRGWEKLREIDGESGEKVIAALKDIAPDLGRYTIEFPFGDIYRRPGLDLRSRQIAVVAALTAPGKRHSPAPGPHPRGAQCRRHPRGEVVEVIIQMAVYAVSRRCSTGWRRRSPRSDPVNIYTSPAVYLQ